MLVNDGVNNGINNGTTGWWFGTWLLLFHSVGNFIIPTDELIFFRGVGLPPTRQSSGFGKCPMAWRFVSHH